MTTPLIACTDISKSFTVGTQTIEILHDLTFSIERGEFLAIVGPSGSGKSTTMNILGFLDTPTEGSYRLEGVPTESFSSSQLADIRAHKVGFIFQSFHLLSQKTVFENVMLPLLYRRDVQRGERHGRAARALEQAQLEEAMWHKKTNVISGGQSQRVAIARALVGSPSLILADEPTGNLDTKTGAHVLETLTALNRTLGTTIIMITHDQTVAAAADRTITIVDGKITSDISRNSANTTV